MDHFDRAPEPLRRLINEFGINPVVQATRYCSVEDVSAMRKFLERNRALAQDEVLENAAITEEDIAKFRAALTRRDRAPRLDPLHDHKGGGS